MSEAPKRIVFFEVNWGVVAIAAMLIACMHYGYSCSCAGCDLVDSKAEVTK